MDGLSWLLTLAAGQTARLLADFDMSKPVDRVALSVTPRAVQCRLLGKDRIVTLRASRIWNVVQVRTEKDPCIPFPSGLGSAPPVVSMLHGR